MSAAYETFTAEVNAAVAAITAMRAGKLSGFGDGYKQVGINISLPACEAAAEITGADATVCKMLNHRFRTDAAAMMFERKAA